MTKIQSKYFTVFLYEQRPLRLEMMEDGQTRFWFWFW